jgi:MFS family permease
LNSEESRESNRIRKDWALFTALTFLFSFGFAVYSGPFQNFLRDILSARELDLGRLESIREIPGLLTALTAGTLIAIAETRIAAIGLVIAGVGIAVTGFCTSFPPLIAITLFWSVGFHLYTTMSTAITLNLAKGKEGGRHLGRMSGVSGAAGIAGLAVVYLLSRIWPQRYSIYFLVAGAAIVIAGLCGAQMTSHAGVVKRQRIVFRKEYGLFYFLTFLEGCRRQIFSIFASFALILVYRVSVQEMLLIQFANALMIGITAPIIGKIIDRRGERAPLAFYAISLVVVFVGYASLQTVGALIALFLIDNVLFSFGVGFSTYLHRIVRPNELTPCLAMGVTMNHVAAVTVPFLGALLWKASGNYQLPFWVGAGIACASLVATRWLPTGVAPNSENTLVAGERVMNDLEEPRAGFGADLF